MKIIDLALHDLTRSLRSVFAIGMTVVAPLLLTGMIYLAFGGLSGGDVAMTPIRVGVVNLDRLAGDSVLDTALGDSIRGMFFDESVAGWITAGDYPDEAAARAAVDRQEIGVAVVIPAGFTDRYLTGDYDTQVLVVSDPTLSIGPAVVEDMVMTMVNAVGGGGIAVLTLQERQQALGLEADPALIPAYIEQYGNWYRDFERALYHDPERAALVAAAPAAGDEAADPLQQTMSLTLAGQMIFFAFFTGSYAMLSIVNDGEAGTLARLFTTPTSTTTILAGKFLAVVLTVVLQGLVLLTAGHFAFGIDWGPPAGVVVGLTAQVVAATGLGVVLIALVKSSRQAGPVLGGGLTVLGMLGGLFTANIPGGMPAAFDFLSNFTPQGWVLKTWRGVLDGVPVADLLVPLAVAVTIGLALFVVGAALFRRRYQ